MARLEDLIDEIDAPALKAALAHEVRALKERMSFGLVFERHLPENVLVSPGAGVAVGDEVRLRKQADDGHGWRVKGRHGDSLSLVDEAGEETTSSVGDVLVLKGFGESVYPTLTPLGTIERSEERPFHTVINGENYHALQVMQHCWEGQVDCIYIDPPYNTGARDWKYNNDYVDSADAWRHSKWLSMMERRLLIAKRLLKPDGVLVCTIDEHEVHHLGVLLEQLFPGVQRQLVTIVINPLGQSRRQELGRVEEYAYILFQGDSRPTPVADDLLNAARNAEQKPRWERLLRGGTDSDRASRARMFYPVFIEPETRRIVTVGEPLPPSASRHDIEAPEGQVLIWPVRTNGTEGRWRLASPTLRDYVEQGVARVGAYDRANDRWSLLYLGDAMRRRIADGDIVVTGRDPVNGAVDVEYANATTTVAKTVWNRGSHRAGEYGSRMLSDFLGDRRFPFPKSLYAVADTLRIAVGDKPDALIVDFFAGSATTLHATALLNRESDGCRRCVVVTNNEVEEGEAARLRARGLHPGDAEYEERGIFEAIARPRVEAALTGLRPDGTSVQGSYLDGSHYADGFEENCEFYRLDYLNPDDVELGRAFEAVHPLLWLMAGARSKRRDDVEPNEPFVVVEEGGYAVLFQEAAVRELVAALNEADDVEHVFLVTNSEDAYAEMSEAIGPGRTTQMLYRDYLRSFRIYAS